MTLSKLDLSEETNSASRLMLEKREKCTRKIGSVCSIHFCTLPLVCVCVYTLRLVGGVHTTLPYTTPPGKKLAVYVHFSIIYTSPASLVDVCFERSQFNVYDTGGMKVIDGMQPSFHAISTTNV
jgi:hypothetical protein